jgi:hypothetical protein
MQEQLGRLGATTVTADTDTALISSKNCKCTVIVCNRGATDRTYRIAHVDGAIGAVANEDYHAYDEDIPANSSIARVIGTVASDESILVRANHADVHFVAEGVEYE